MRSEAEIKQLILNKAIEDSRIRAVLLNGSRANDKVKPDEYQDYDVVYIVTDLHSFTKDDSWTDFFGERIIEQLPATMDLYSDDKADAAFSFSYLMLFKDFNRIDLALVHIDHLRSNFSPGSLTIVWLDKDNLFTGLRPATDADYNVMPPAQKEFFDVCNEFWWVSTYVAKGLKREEITYAKEMLETVVRPMFMKMIAWYIGTETGFTVSVGKAGKFIKQYLQQDLYQQVLATYAGHSIDDNWKSLFKMTELFSFFAKEVAEGLGLHYNLREEQNVTAYLKNLIA